MRSAPPIEPTPRLTWQHLLVRLGGAVAVIFIVLAGAVYGYLRIFSQFAAYDDEGYVMQSVRSFVEGHRLYDEVFSQYGPAYFLLQRIGYGLLHLPLTHDVVRLGALAMWIGTAVATAAIVRRLTRSLVLAGIVFVHVVVHIVPLINEPGHPQTLLGLTIAVTCLIVAADRDEISRGQAAWCGGFAAFAALIKINVGAYLFLGVAIPLVLASPLGRVAGPLLLILAPAVPLLVLRQHLLDLSANYAAIGALSAASLVLVCWRLLRDASVPLRTLRVFAVTFAATSALVLCAMLVLGTSPKGLLQGILIQPTRLSDVFYMPVAISRNGTIAAAAAFMLAALLTSQRLIKSAAWPSISFAAKMGLAVGMLYASQSSYVALMEYVTPFLWIVMLPGTQVESSRARVARGVLAGVGIFQFLQAYPVGGSQVPFATMLLVPAGMVCLHDAMAIVAARVWSYRPAMAAFEAFALVWAATAYTPVVGSEVLRHYYRVYMGSEELRLPGASRLRLPPDDVARLHWLTGTLQTNCSSFVALPGFQSLHAWTGIRPLTAQNAGTWMTLLTATEQERIWSAVDSEKTPCAIFQRQLAMNWIGNRPLDELPAYRNLMARFHTIAEVDGYELMTRRDSGDARSADVMMALVAGRQTFEKNRPGISVVSRFVHAPESTIRTWVKSTKRGVILGCESHPPSVPPTRWLPLLYIGNSGRLYGQHDVSITSSHGTRSPINDGRWHHVVLIRHDRDESLYVDGALEVTSTGIEEFNLPYCQAGIGTAAQWPDASAGSMALVGEIEGLAVQSRAWSAEEVARDRARTVPRD